MMETLRTRVLYPLSILAGLVVWELWARELPRAVLAPPSVVLARLVRDVASAELPLAFVRAMGHLVLGYALALLAAVPLGFLMGRSPRAFHALDPVMNAIYAVPAVAFVPFLIIWFGLFFPARVALVFIMCFFEILVTVTAGVRDVSPGLLDVGRSFGAGRRALVRKVVFPAALPFLFAALRIGLVRGVNAMITAELFFAAVNLGGLMKQSASNFDTAGLVGVIVVLSGFGLAAQEGLKAIEARLLPWHIRG
jgi:ABC-type nitrate/sulfonate/bicarbonate transport system permease component